MAEENGGSRRGGASARERSNESGVKRKASWNGKGGVQKTQQETKGPGRTKVEKVEQQRAMGGAGRGEGERGKGGDVKRKQETARASRETTRARRAGGGRGDARERNQAAEEPGPAEPSGQTKNQCNKMPEQAGRAPQMQGNRTRQATEGANEQGGMAEETS